MKHFSKVFVLAVLCMSAAAFSACGTDDDTAVTSADISETQTETEAEITGNAAGETEDGDLWADALYTEDTELGEGDTTIIIEVAANERSVSLTVHTNEDNLGAALTSNSLAEGDESEYGLYIKTVNGIRADYDLDGAYWAISKDGEMTPTGADTTMIADGEHYELTYTKG